MSSGHCEWINQVCRVVHLCKVVILVIVIYHFIVEYIYDYRQPPVA